MVITETYTYRPNKEADVESDASVRQYSSRERYAGRERRDDGVSTLVILNNRQICRSTAG